MNGANHRVGPILEAGRLAECVVSAIRALNEDVEVVDRGSYWRVTAPRRCLLTIAAVEESCGQSFRLPSDLERVMTSFVGRLAFEEDRVLWLADGEVP